MLNDEQLNEYLAAMGVADAGRAYIRRVRRSDPSRAVGSGARNVACRFASRKMGRTIQAESHTGELPALWLWEFDSATYEFWDQPEAIAMPLIRSDGRRTMQPKTADFLVLQADFVGWVECKPRAWLEQRLKDGDPNFSLDAEGRWHYQPGEQAAADWGMGFAVRADDENNPVLVDNLAFLDDYLTSDAPEVPAEIRDRICTKVAEAGWPLISDLLADPEMVADHLYALIARRVLHVRLNEDRISETWRTRVFRDELAANGFAAHTLSTVSTDGPDISTVDLSTGASLFWDGKVYTILNAGLSELVLENEDHVVIPLALDAAQALIGQGRILAGPAAPDSRSERAAERLRQATEAERAEATRRYQALHPTGCLPAMQVPQRTLSGWRRAYRRGEELYGNGFLGLLPNIHLRGNRLPKLPPATHQIIDQVIRAHYLTDQAKSLVAVWGVAKNECRAAGTMEPSEAAVKRAIARSFTEVDIVKARRGAKAAYQVEPWCWYLDDDTARHGQRPFEIGHVDHTEVDLQLIDVRFKRKTRKCWVSALIDAYSRKVLAIYVTFDAPSYRSCMMLVRECVRRHGRVPATIVVDWGKDFRSEYFEQLLAYLGVQKKHRPKGASRHGSLIERLFRRANDDFIHQLCGNNKALQKPRSMSKSHDPREKAIWTLEAFTEWFNAYLDDVYAQQVHATLGVSPAQAFEQGMRESGDRAHRRVAYDEAFRMITLPSVKSGAAEVRSGAFVRINHIAYSAPELAAPGTVGRKLRVRYDPFDVGHAYACLGDRWIELKSQHSAVFSRYTEKEILAASEELRERLGGAGKHRPVNAEKLARFLLMVESFEEQLQANEDERKARKRALQLIASEKPAAPRPLPARRPLPRLDGAEADTDAFDDVAVVDYGDME